MYLARYTHRVAISNGRLISLENGQVSPYQHRSASSFQAD
jgi:Putative transposase